MIETSDYDKLVNMELPTTVAELNLLFFLIVNEDELDGDWKRTFGWQSGWVEAGRDQA
jgi:hypothetical protein